MNTGQTLLTLCAMFLLSMVILRVNKTFLVTGDVMYNTKFEVLATSLGTSMIEEANSKAFDAVTDTSAILDPLLLTTADRLGPEGTETYLQFNDFDDYNNFVKIDSTMPAATFKIACKVGYIKPADPSTFVNERTYHKGIIVTVTSPSMADTVRLSSVFSYWYYR